MDIFDSFVNGLLAMGDSLCPREDYSYKKYIYGYKPDFKCSRNAALNGDFNSIASDIDKAVKQVTKECKIKN